MAGDVVNVPFFGDQRKEYLIAGGAVVAAYLGYKAYKKRSGATATAATAAPGGTNALGTFAGYDATGAPVYTNAAGQSVDANGNPDTVVTPAGVGGSGYQNPGPITVSGSQNTGAGSAPQTDQAWTAAVEQDLTGLGYDPQAVATALAQYLASQPLDSAQITVIRTAWAYEGRPPQHPSLPIVQQQGGGQPPPGGGGGSTGGGDPWQLTGKAIGPTEVDLSWKAQPPPWNGTYRVMYGVSGHVEQEHYDTTATSAKIGALKGGTPYTFSIEGVSGGVLSPPSPQVQIQTPA